MAFTIMLTLLKIAGIVLLCILAFILFTFLCLLFVPFRYKVLVEKYECLNGFAAVSWLFGIFRFAYEFRDSAGMPSVSILGFTVWRDKKDKSEGEYTQTRAVEMLNNEAGAASENTIADDIYIGGGKPHVKKADDNLKVKKDEQSKRDKYDAGYGRNESTQTESRRADKVKRKHNKKVEKVSAKEERSARETLKKLWSYDNKRDILEQAVLLVKRLIRAITRFKVRARLKIGTGQPDTTGSVIGLCWAASGITGADIKAEGDFENETLSGETSLKGRLFVFSIVWAILLFVLNKNIFPIVKKLIFKKG